MLRRIRATRQATKQPERTVAPYACLSCGRGLDAPGPCGVCRLKALDAEIDALPRMVTSPVRGPSGPLVCDSCGIATSLRWSVGDAYSMRIPKATLKLVPGHRFPRCGGCTAVWHGAQRSDLGTVETVANVILAEHLRLNYRADLARTVNRDGAWLAAERSDYLNPGDSPLWWIDSAKTRASILRPAKPKKWFSMSEHGSYAEKIKDLMGDPRGRLKTAPVQMIGAWCAANDANPGDLTDSQFRELAFACRRGRWPESVWVTPGVSLNSAQQWLASPAFEYGTMLKALALLKYTAERGTPVLDRFPLPAELVRIARMGNKSWGDELGLRP